MSDQSAKVRPKPKHRRTTKSQAEQVQKMTNTNHLKRNIFALQKKEKRGQNRL